MRDPLTLEELRLIGRYCRSSVVRALLWEIYRLQGILGRVEQIQSMLGASGKSQDSMFTQVLQLLRAELDRDPSIQRRRQETRDLLHAEGQAPPKAVQKR